MANITYTKSVPLRYEVDVFIAGGGPAGVAAAVAASRNGSSVFVAEAFSAFGGAGVSMLVPAFMQFSNGVDFLAGGIGKEVYDYLKDNSPDAYKTYCPTSIPVET
nr:FAD-dependent oxidoreductase [Clostridia bacterium]